MISTAYNPQTAAFLAGLNAIEARAQQAQSELTTGMKLNQISDDPSGVPNLLQVEANISQNDQITSNLSRVNTETTSAETALSDAVTQLQQAQSLAAEGATDFASSDTRQQLAAQLGDVLQNMVGLSNTSVEGRYIFAGDDDQQQPYTIDMTQTDPVSAYLGSASTRQIQAPDGTMFSVSESAQDIFDSSTANNNVFNAINNARLALLNNDDSSLTDAQAQLSTAGSYLNDQLAFYGTVQDQLTSATNDANSLSTSLQTERSNIQDADETQSITNLTMAQTQEEAALSSEAALPQKTLFDYLG